MSSSGVRPSGDTEIDGRHDGVVEAIGVDMHEEAVEVRPQQMIQRRPCGGFDP